jgi:Protein of unknown function (DUF1553)/Protein of unknown function (DUF1549)
MNTARRIFVFTLLAFSCLFSAPQTKKEDWWSLKPVVRPEVPQGLTKSSNPIDAFIAAKQKEKRLQPAPEADKLTLLRRVYLDLVGYPPTPAEQDAFLQDASPDAYEKVVDRLLASEQHGVRYARHWLDVLRYADIDDRMTAAPGIHYWRDWVISALNQDLPYDQFVRTQLTGYRDGEYTTINENGIRSRKEPRPYDLFALGFLARGNVIRDNTDTKELPIVSVETVSTAFMGMTVGCAKCHDHKFDPISNRDFYAMKALFDPMVVKKITLASQQEILDHDKAQSEYAAKKAAADKQLDEFIAPYREKYYEKLRESLPPDVKAVFLKPEKERTAAEVKIADAYHVIFKVTAEQMKPYMPPDVLKKYQELQKAADARPPAELPAFWTVEDDSLRLTEPSYILTSGEPTQPQKDKPVQPGWPFEPPNVEFTNGRREAFADWLTAPENPFFARVAVNRLWQWHFGQGIQANPSDFGKLGGKPSDPALLDWLASEFVARNFSMRAMNRLIVTSEAYKRSSHPSPELMTQNMAVDANDTYLWRFRLLRLEAEPLWDSILSSAGDLDLTVGGKSFRLADANTPGGGGGRLGRQNAVPQRANRRGIYIERGYQQSGDVMPNFLQVFDVDDGRLPCPERTRTVTAPQSLFLMNDDIVIQASGKLASKVLKETNNDVNAAVDLAYRITLVRPPSKSEKDFALTYVENNPDRMKGLAWLLFNLDEFAYVR